MAENSLTFLFIIAGICILIGAVFGWMFGSMRGGEEKPKAAPAPAQPAAPPAAVPPAEPPALLRLTRDPATGSLRLETNGTAAQSAEQLSAEQRKQVVDLLKETSAWLGLYKPASPAAPIATQPPPPAVTPAVPPQAQPVLEVAPPAESPKFSMMGGVTNAIANALGPGATIKEAPKSMVQQIDEILQTRLAGTPHAHHGINLTEDPRRGVLVHIGSEVYEGVGGVPEGEIKNLLKSCVADWERRQEDALRRKPLR